MIRLLLHAGFQHRHATDAQQQPRHDERAGNTPLAQWRLRRDQEGAPPEPELADVIGIASVASQAAIQDLSFVRGIGLEMHELRIGDGFEQKAEHGEHATRNCHRAKLRLIVPLSQLDGQ